MVKEEKRACGKSEGERHQSGKCKQIHSEANCR